MAWKNVGRAATGLHGITRGDCAATNILPGQLRSERIARQVRRLYRPRPLSVAPSTRELHVLTRLAGPIVLTNLLWMVVSTVDIAMLGHMPGDGSGAVAAASLAAVWVSLTQMMGMGLVMGMDPLVTQGHGARDREALGRSLQRGLIIALVASVPVVGLRFFTAEFLGQVRAVAGELAGPAGLAALELENIERLAGPAESYALAQSFATPFFLVFIALRQYLQGRGILRPALVVAFVANLVNVALNWLLIFVFEQGIVGAGIATGATRAFTAVGLGFLVWRLRLLRGAWIPWDVESFRWSGLTRVLRYGFPTALQFLFEMGAFGASTLIAGTLGVTATVAHAVTINLASLTYMLPLGVALGATTRVGNLIGEGRFERAQTSARTALILGAATMAMLGALLYAGRFLLPRVFTDDADAILLAAGILPIAAAFQVFDGLQVVGSGVLRGMGKTTAPAAFNLFAWWVIALPTGAWLVFRRGGTLQHLWWALVLGLGVVSILVVLWVRYRGPSSLDESIPLAE